MVRGWPARLPTENSPSAGRRASSPGRASARTRAFALCGGHVSLGGACVFTLGLCFQALESDFVSANLHHWIDLIFGFKQQGPAAVEAVNTFHPYFYGDKVDLGSIGDPLIRNTILGFVSNFGQVPKQVQHAMSLSSFVK